MAALDIIVVGAGGSARETLMLLLDIEAAEPGTWAFRGFVAADAPSLEVLARIDAPYLGEPARLTELLPQAAGWHAISGIGDPVARRAMDAAMLAQGLTLATLVHPTALIGRDVWIGAGSQVCAYSVITTNVRIGRSAQVNIGCVIGHDARIGDYLTLAQGVHLAGNVTIDDDVTLHTGVSVNRGLRMGAGAVVGSGAVVTSDVEPGTTSVGVPARPLRAPVTPPGTAP